MSLLREPGTFFEGEISNPLTHVVNPQSVRLEIDEIEERLRDNAIPEEAVVTTVVNLAEKYSELGQNERAIALLQKALQTNARADSHILNLLGIYCGKVGDSSKQEKFYRAASKCGDDDAPLFNLALAQKGRRDFDAALKTIEELESRRIDGPGLTLKVSIMDSLQRTEGRAEVLESALAAFPGLNAQSDWQLDWYHTAARQKGDLRLERAIEAERKSRHREGERTDPEGELPIATMSPVVSP